MKLGRLASLSALVAIVAVTASACGKTAAPPTDTKCQSDSDCVLYCEARGDCCHNPYCDSVMHRVVADDARKYNSEHCKKDDLDKCPQVGARAPRDFEMVPRCRAQACVAERVSNADAAAVGPQ